MAMSQDEDELLNRLRARADDLTRCNDSVASRPTPETLLFFGPPRPRRTGVRYPCASEAVIADAEAELGFRLPQFLRTVYRVVGNGGFGPGSGLIGLKGGATHEDGQNLVQLYQQWESTAFDRRDDRDLWPERLLPICSYGCASYSCLDCSRRSGEVLYFDNDAYVTAEEPCLEDALLLESPSLALWFEWWLDGLRVDERRQEAADQS